MIKFNILQHEDHIPGLLFDDILSWIEKYKVEDMSDVYQNDTIMIEGLPELCETVLDYIRWEYEEGDDE